LAGDLSHPQTIAETDQQNSEREHRCFEPAGLIKERFLRDAEDDSLPVPNTIPIAQRLDASGSLETEAYST
jgi:hypothetical protein